MLTREELAIKMVKHGRVKGKEEARRIIDGVFADIEKELLKPEGYVKLMKFGSFYVENGEPKFKPSTTMRCYIQDVVTYSDESTDNLDSILSKLLEAKTE